MDAQTWDERYDSQQALWGREPNAMLPDLVADLVPGRALDLAAGEGRNALWLAARGWDVTAVDFSAVAIERARTAAADGNLEVHWVLADLREWDPGTAGFDLIIEFFLHLEPSVRRAVNRRAVRALAPNGRFVVLGHDIRNLAEGHGGPQMPEVLYEIADLTLDLEGLDIIRADVVERPVDDGAAALDTLIVAQAPPG